MDLGRAEQIQPWMATAIEYGRSNSAIARAHVSIPVTRSRCLARRTITCRLCRCIVSSSCLCGCVSTYWTSEDTVSRSIRSYVLDLDRQTSCQSVCRSLASNFVPSKASRISITASGRSSYPSTVREFKHLRSLYTSTTPSTRSRTTSSPATRIPSSPINKDSERDATGRLYKVFARYINREAWPRSQTSLFAIFGNRATQQLASTIIVLLPPHRSSRRQTSVAAL